MADEAGANRGRGDRGGRDGRAAAGAQPGRASSTPCASVRASRSRSSPARRKGGSPISPSSPDYGLGQGSLVVFDTGGGSSQFTFGQGDQVDERFSLNVGAARFTERYGLDGVVSEDELAAALAAIAADLARLDGRPAPDTVVGMGGAITNLTAVKHGLAAYDPEVVQGSVLDLRRGRPPDRPLPHPHHRRAP